MSRGLLLALIGGLASAILSVVSFGSAPIIATGLSLGATLGSIAAAIGALLILIMLNGLTAVAYIAMTAVPAMIIVRQALISRPGENPATIQWYPPGLILTSLTIYGLAALAAIALFFAVSGQGLETASRDFLRQAANQFSTQRPEDLVERMGPILPGLMISASIILLIFNAALAQGALVRIGHALRPSPAYAGLTLPRWLGAALAAAVLAAFLPGAPGRLGENAMIVLSTPFFLLGLAVIHTLSRRAPSAGLVLAAVYLALFLLGTVLGPLIVLLGLVEQWISLRQRFAAGGANQEDE